MRPAAAPGRRRRPPDAASAPTPTPSPTPPPDLLPGRRATQDPFQPSALAAAAVPAQIQAPGQAAAAAAAGAGAQTVARLATQIVQTAHGPASQFNLVLHPAELGGVQVKIQVDRNGQVRADLAFDNPQAAADLKAQAEDLKAQLAQAGFDVADGGLSFSLSSQGGQAQGDSAAQQGLMGGRAFRSAAAGADDLLTQVNEAATRLSNTSAAGGLDIRI